ncbi:hypothetical protein [Formosa sp. S-31]|uniref:hypothetical protein n=1 Tax=Formosa sp. S-31 TaxID=2790949 RepID=UPI003EBD40E4
MKRLCFLICFTLCFTSIAQTNLNQYKYVIVPETFEFLKEPNKYNMNALTKFLFDKYGFTAIMEGEDIPADLNSNGCLALRSDVINESSLFTTKLKVQLKDCKNQVVYVSNTGTTKEKEYQKAYQVALREAFESFEALNYKFEGTTAATVAPVASSAVVPVTPVVAEELHEATDAQIQTAPAAVSVASGTVLYAQAIPQGYQLVDSTPKVVYKLKQSGLKHVYFVEGKQAIVYKNGESWIVEYYEGTQLKQETLNIKF